MTALREVVHETRHAIEAIRRACTSQLAPYHVEDRLYGCGVEGCVYKAGAHAAKISLNEEEARAARWVQGLGRGRPPALPEIHDVRTLKCGGLSTYLILREDLDDLRASDPRLVNKALTAVETATAFSLTAFGPVERARAAGALRLLGSYIGIARRDAWIVKQLRTFTVWSVERGVAWLDLHTQNLGVRAGEKQVVIRDFGHSDIPDAPKDIPLVGRRGRRRGLARMVIGQRGFVARALTGFGVT